MLRPALILIGFVVPQVAYSPPPSLRVSGVSPIAAPHAECMVTLTNPADQLAIAWVLLDDSHPGEGSSYDYLTGPAAGIKPGETRSVPFPCAIGTTPQVTVASVQFADAAITGDTLAMERNVLARRRQRAKGLRELQVVLSAARLSEASTGPPAEQMMQLVELSSGPSIDASAKSHAWAVVTRVAHRLSGSALAASSAAFRAALLKEFEEEAAFLNRYSLDHREVR